MMLSKKAKEAIKSNPALQGRLAGALPQGERPRSVQTIMRWVYEDNTILLTTAAAMQVIREETGLTDEEILTPQTVR